MAEEQGIVLKTSGNGWAEVITERKEACADCGASQCCESLAGASKMVSRAKNTVGAEPGDLVRLNLGSGAIAKSAALLYLVPLTGLIAGVVAGANVSIYLGMNETGSSILFGFIGLALGFFMTALISRLLVPGDGFSPEITLVMKRKARTLSDSMAIDPVCKMAVTPATAPASQFYKGHTYYFCHPNCKDVFLREPERYL